jgi:hypothetical protein
VPPLFFARSAGRRKRTGSAISRIRTAAALIFADLPDSIELINFSVRYQSIVGTQLGDSGTGRGTTITPLPTEVPEPGMLALLGAGLLVAGVPRRRRVA